MKNCKKLIAICLALATVFSFTVFASAAGTDISASGDSASASVNLSSTVDGSLTGDPAATAMSVTVPTVLPIAVGTDGTVTTATDAKIVNNSYARCGSPLSPWKPPAAGVSPGYLPPGGHDRGGQSLAAQPQPLPRHRPLGLLR